MSTPRVVPAFDEVEDGAARVGLGAEAFAIEQLALERREEALAHGVVVGIAHTAHRRPDAGLASAPAEGERRVLVALIRVMNHLGRSALRDGHVERGQDELGAEVGFHCPADDPATPRVEHDGEIQEAGPRRDVRDVRDPQPIGAVNWRSTRSGAGRAASSRTVVWNGFRRLTPCTPAVRMSRATRLQPTWKPRAASSAWMRGAPYVPRDIR